MESLLSRRQFTSKKPSWFSRAAVTMTLITTLVGCGGGADNSNGSAEASTQGQKAVEAKAKPGGSKAAFPTAVASAGADGNAALTPRAESPPLEIVPPILDFGFVPPNTDVEGSVALVNRGSEPLLILAAEPSCKCTTLSDLGGTTIPPGGQVEMKAVLDGASNTGPKKAEIKVLVDGYPVVKKIDLKAEVALRIRATPPFINAVRGQNRQGRTIVQSNDGEPFRICSLHGMPPTFIGFNPETDEPRSKYVLTYDLETIEEPFPRYLVVETDQSDVPMVDLYLRHETTLPKVNRNLRMAGGYRHPTGVIPPDGSVEIEIPFGDNVDSIATVVALSTDQVTADLVSSRVEIGSDGEKKEILLVKITAAPGFSGVFYQPLLAMSQTGQEAEFPIFGIVGEVGGQCGEVTRTSGL